MLIEYGGIFGAKKDVSRVSLLSIFFAILASISAKMSGADFMKNPFEIASHISINLKIYLAMEGCTAFDNTTGNVTTTIFMKDNVVMGKREVEIYGKNKIEIWFNAAGKKHREGDQPAVICYKNDKITEQRWIKDGKDHREGDLPAIIYYEDDKITSQYWCKDDKIHREGDQPAIIEYKDGEIISQSWRKDCKYHREGDQPAKICYKNGKIIFQYWYKDDKIHREGDQPAIILYKDDKITEQRWYKNGMRQPEPKPKEPIADILTRIRADLAEIEARLAEISQ